LNSAVPWLAVAADGVTPSSELSIVIGSSRRRLSADPFAGYVSGTASSLNHSLRRNFVATDLTQFDQLRLWVHSDRRADGSPAHPFFLEMMLASAALGLDDPANTWRRYLPVSQTGVWEPVRLDIGDLDPAIRSAMTQMRLRCINAARPFNCGLDDIIAVRDDMISDVDDALIVRLNNILSVNGNLVPAFMHPAGGVLVQGRPYFEITHYDVVFSHDRTDSTRPRGDFTDKGYTLRPASYAYQLYYQITAEADDRESQSQMLQFVLRAMPPRGELLVNGYLLPIESVAVQPFDEFGNLRTDNVPLYYKVSTRQEVGSAESVVGASTVIIAGDLRS
jgi:hypothetical protein